MEQKKTNTKVGTIWKKKSKKGTEYYVLELGKTFGDEKYRFSTKIKVTNADGTTKQVENGKLFLSVPKNKEGEELNIADKFGGKLLFNVEILDDNY